MKKHLVLGALAVLALAACTKSEVVELNRGNEISLSAVSGKNLTKAADGYCNNSLPTSFDVWAATASKTYFEKETYNRDGTTNTYKSTVARYWPASAVDFFAAHNYGVTPSFTASGTTSLAFNGYTVADNVGDQKDFIYSVTKGVTKPAGGAADINFRHALSQIEFRAKNGNKNIRVFIDGVKVVNVKNTGNFTMTAATTNNFIEHTNGVANDTDSRVGRGVWTDQSGKQTYSVSFPEVPVPGNGTAVNLTYPGTSTAYSTNSMYLLPQNVDVWDPKSTTPPTPAQTAGQDKAYFVVNALIYNDKDADPALTFNKADNVVLWGTNDGSGNWTSKPIAVQLPAMEWKDGFRYLYTFNFTDYGVGGSDPETGDPVLTPITLEVTVDDFVDVADKEIEVK